jgi:hypothetical protein
VVKQVAGPLGRDRQLAALIGGALAQQQDESLFGHRLAEQKSLAEIAAHADEGDGVRGLLDAHGNGFAPESVGEIDHGPADRRVGFVDASIQRTTFLEPRQYGVALAEFIVRPLHIEGPQLFAEFAGEREIADDLFLRHIDDQARTPVREETTPLRYLWRELCPSHPVPPPSSDICAVRRAADTGLYRRLRPGLPHLRHTRWLSRRDGTSAH